jgi:putative toxin-antitoxin system antitoxin component (TIGR02293 family)
MAMTKMRRGSAGGRRRRSAAGEPRGAIGRLAEGTVAIIDCEQPGDSIGVRYGSLLQAAKLVKSGLPFAVIRRLQETTGLTLERIKGVARLSAGSFARRKRSGRLSPDASERVLRLGRIFERATSLYGGDQAGAMEWLETPIPSLGNQRPLDLAQTEPGGREVEDLIGRIEHGVLS